MEETVVMRKGTIRAGILFIFVVSPEKLNCVTISSGSTKNPKRESITAAIISAIPIILFLFIVLNYMA